MDRIRIRGGRQLNGEIRISGAKNAALPLMVASMLSDRPLTLHNVPRLADITTMMQLLRQHGVEITTTAGENGHSHGTTMVGTIRIRLSVLRRARSMALPRSFPG